MISHREFGSLAATLDAEEVAPTLVDLPISGRALAVRTLRRREQRWNGPTPPSFASVPKKAPLDFEALPTWAEIIVVKLLERSGWEAVWVKNWNGRAFWKEVNTPVLLPEMAAALFKKIELTTGLKGGCWDIYGWRGEGVLFVELKQRKRDRISLNQRKWIEAALSIGVPLSAFVVAEWDAGRR